MNTDNVNLQDLWELINDLDNITSSKGLKIADEVLISIFKMNLPIIVKNMKISFNKLVGDDSFELSN